MIVHKIQPYSRDSTSESDCSQIVTADTFVKYGPVEIGGQSSICPLKSVSISRARARVKILDWNQIRSITDLQITVLDDNLLENYRRFRGDVQILSGNDAEPDERSTPVSPLNQFTQPSAPQ